MIDLDKFTPAELDKLRRDTSMKLAPQLPFSALGYKHHYAGIFTHELPSFGWDWVQEFFELYDQGVRRFGVKAHRGATKSTIWTIGFATYVLAKQPTDSVLIVQKSDTAAGKTSSSVASIIEENAGWKEMYPHLVPDKSKRWAFEGYEIMDSSVPYPEWRQKVLDVHPKDNSFVAYGWSNGGIVGMHPSWMFVDDILDEENTRSKREMGAVSSTMKGNVLQTLNRPPEWDNTKNYKEPCAVFSYTPWYEDDFYAYIEATGAYHIMETPLIQESDKDAKGAFEWRSKYWTCAWPVKDPVKHVEAKLAEWGERDFARMQLLDLSKAKGINLKRDWLHDFPGERILSTWPVYIGVDYASSADTTKTDRDNFALAVGRVIPMGGVVLIDGFMDVLTSGDAELKVKAYASMYNPVEIGFDKTGKGEDAFNRLRASGLNMTPCPPKGEGKRSKGERFEGQGGLGSAFQFSQAWISDIETSFLKAFRDEWASWPAGHDDTLDAVYWMLHVARAFLVVQPQGENLTLKTEKQRSGFATMARALENRR
jgi:hypothetical protein